MANVAETELLVGAELVRSGGFRSEGFKWVQVGSGEFSGGTSELWMWGSV